MSTEQLAQALRDIAEHCMSKYVYDDVLYLKKIAREALAAHESYADASKSCAKACEAEKARAKHETQPVAWHYVLRDAIGSVNEAVSIDRYDLSITSPFGRAGIDYSASMTVREDPLYAAAPAVESPCQFAIDGGGNIYRRYSSPVCVACVAAEKVTDKWESARVADFNAGWNACRSTILAAAPAAPVAVPLAQEIGFLEAWLRFAAEPIGLQCCGYGRGGECCGNPEAVYPSADQVLEAMNERHKQILAGLASKEGGQG